MSLLVSVVVPTYCRPALLDRCLQALTAQNFPPQAYEIIIVDDGPLEPRTRDLVHQWQQRLLDSYPLLVPPFAGPALGEGSGSRSDVGHVLEMTYHLKTTSIPQPRIFYRSTTGRRGPAAARNIGWRAAQGELIAFTDDDCIPDPDWLANGVSAFEDGVAGVSGRTVVPLPENPNDNQLNVTGLQRSDFITANCFYRRSALEAVGGFDERFAAAWREDSDLYFTLREQNYPLAWTSGAVVVHPVRPEKWGSSLHQQRKSFYNALIYKKHPQLYWRYIQPSPPWHYYGMAASLLAALGGLTLGAAWLVAIGLLAWLVQVSTFTVHRLQHTARTPSHVAEMILTSLAIPFLSIFWRLRGAVHWRVWFL